jgi:hypothetical protein
MSSSTTLSSNSALPRSTSTPPSSALTRVAERAARVGQAEHDPRHRGSLAVGSRGEQPRSSLSETEATR